MCSLLRECLDAGAVGLSTSYVDVEDDLQPVPCRWAEHAELEALCGVLAERGRMLQIVHEFFDPGLTDQPDRDARRAVDPLRHPDDVLAAVPQRGHAGEHRPGDGRRRAGVGRRRPRVAAGADPTDRHLLDDGPAQHHVPRHPGVVERAVDGRRRQRSSRRCPTRPSRPCSRPGSTPSPPSPARRWTRRPTSCATSPSTATSDLVGRTLGDIATERGTTPAQLLIDLSIEEELGTWFQRAGIGHSDGAAVGGLLAHPLGPRRGQRRGRPRRLVRHLRRHRVPVLPLRPRARRARRSRRR